MMKTIHSIKLLLLITALLSTACSREELDRKEKQSPAVADLVILNPEQQRTIGLKTATPEQRELSGVIKANGKLDVPPQQLISISIPFGGFLKHTELLQGARVSKGQEIAVIENPEFIQMQQDYMEAKAQLDYAKADYERQQDLAKENVNAQKTLQLAKANYQALLGKSSGLKAKLKILNIDAATLENGDIQPVIKIYSPINGYVTQVNANIGSFVNPQDVVFKIVDTEHLHAELTIFEKDIPKVRIGQKVVFTLANETVERSATVHLIGREIGPDRTVQIHCHLDKEDKDLLPGMYLSAIVETGNNRVWTVPDKALVAFEGKNYLFVQSGADAFQLTEIKTGISEAGYTEVTLTGKASATSKIVVEGAYSLISELKNTIE